MGHLNSFLARWGGIWTKVFQKFKCPGLCPGGFKIQFDWYIKFSYCVIPENNLSIPPPWKGFFLRPFPHPSGNSNYASYISLNVLASQNPHLPENSNPFCGGSMDIFWNCTLHSHLPFWQTPVPCWVCTSANFTEFSIHMLVGVGRLLMLLIIKACYNMYRIPDFFRHYSGTQHLNIRI